MKRSSDIWIAVALSLLFIAINSYFVYRQSLVISAVPFLLLVGAWVVFAPTKLFFALVLLAPLSIPLRRLAPGLDFDFWFPTEPILVFLLVMLILKSFSDGYFRRELLGHPVFLAMLFYLGWLLITCIPSEMPIVSVKYFAVRLWYIGVFFYLAYILFRTNRVSINHFLWAYMLGMLAVSLFSLVKQAQLGLFDHKVAHGASAPFFIDHTSYGAALAFTVPISVALAASCKRRRLRYALFGLAAYFGIALVLSYSRAAWLSLMVGAGVWVLILLKIRFRTIALWAVALVALFLTFQHEIAWRLERNTTDSSGDLMEHVQSIVNIKSDASNLERINRWDAALGMFKERPLFGWGPGTYQFQYAPFQASYNKTIISTNFGTGGNAHSEYLGLMAEAGVPAVAGFVLIVVLILVSGLRLTAKTNLGKEDRYIATACVVGLVTYVFHGFLNNFLDADKIAAPFWGFMAIILALEYSYRQVGVMLK